VLLLLLLLALVAALLLLLQAGEAAAAAAAATAAATNTATDSSSSSSSSFAHFAVGGSWRASEKPTLDILSGVNATHARFIVLWRYLEPRLLHVNASLSVAALRSHPDTIYAYERSLDWRAFDAQYAALLQRGIVPIVEVGEGTLNGLPLLGASPSRVPADVGALGRELYLAYQ
jgi:hypothetical protein